MDSMLHVSDPEVFAEKVKAVRDKLGISQEDLARELGISFSTVNRWENEKTQPSRLAVKPFETFCAKMKRTGKL